MNILKMCIKGLGIFLCFFVVIMGFMWSMRAGYDNIPAVHSVIDAIGNSLMH